MGEQQALDLSPPAAPSQTPSASQPAAVQPAASEARQPDIRGHSPARDQREASATPPAGARTVKVGDDEFPEQTVRDAITARAEAEARRLTLPPSADGYKLELPADLVLPQGASFEFQTDHPVLGGVIKSAQEFAKANNLSQEQFSGMMGLYAASQAHEQSVIATAQAQQLQRLGPAAPARVDAVNTWLKGHLGDKAKAFGNFPVIADMVEGFETLMRKMSNPSGSTFSPQHRSHPEPGRIDGYENMTFEQRREAQDAIAARRR